MAGMTGAELQASMYAGGGPWSGYGVTVTGPAGGPYVFDWGILSAFLDGSDPYVSSETWADCTPHQYGYGYDAACVKSCATCDPSCALAGSPFSGTLSSDDWDGPGYTFAAGTATGTGTLTHRTEIHTLPYVLACRFAADKVGTYTISADAVHVVIVVTSAGSPPVLSATIAVAGGVAVAFHPGEVSLSICRHATSVTVGAEDFRGKVSAPAPSVPAFVSFSTTATAVVVRELTAFRHKVFWSQCPHCQITDVCGTCDSLHFPPDTLSVDFTLATLTDGQCGYCAELAKVWGVEYAIDHVCQWIGGVSPACVYTQHSYLGDVVSPLIDVTMNAHFVVTVQIEYGHTSGMRWTVLAQLVTYFYSGGLFVLWHQKWASYESEDFPANECDVLPRTLSFLDSGEWHRSETLYVPFWENFCAGGSWPTTITLS